MRRCILAVMTDRRHWSYYKTEKKSNCDILFLWTFENLVRHCTRSIMTDRYHWPYYKTEKKEELEYSVSVIFWKFSKALYSDRHDDPSLLVILQDRKKGIRIFWFCDLLSIQRGAVQWPSWRSVITGRTTRQKKEELGYSVRHCTLARYDGSSSLAVLQDRKNSN